MIDDECRCVNKKDVYSSVPKRVYDDAFFSTVFGGEGDACTIASEGALLGFGLETPPSLVLPLSSSLSSPSLSTPTPSFDDDDIDRCLKASVALARAGGQGGGKGKARPLEAVQVPT